MKLIENEKLKNEWNYDKNKDIDINSITIWSSKKVWWKCPKCGSDYDSKVGARTKGTNCPYCAGRRVNHTNSLGSLKPELLKYWDYDKNIKTPYDYLVTSRRMTWLICDNRHSYEAEIKNFANGTKCPYCLGSKVCDDNCLETKNPTLALEWNYSKNKDLTPRDVTPGSNKKVWWRCEKCRSEWKSTVNNRNNGNGCPYCTGRKVNHTNSFEALNPDLVKYWDYDKNNKLPSEYTSASGIKVWWKCANNHSYKAIIASVSYGNELPYCPYCVSFGYNFPEKLEEWHPTKNGNLTPFDVTCGSGKKVWWVCENDHEWKTSVVHRTRGVGCPYCAGKKADVHNNLKVTNPKLSEEWCYELNNSRPEEYLPYSNKKVWWECEKCSNKWLATISDRSIGRGCPVCNESKGEKAIRHWLESYDIEYNSQVEYKGLKGLGGGNLSYDFYLPKLNILIEYQGEFHDGSSGEYSRLNLERQKEHDKRKREYARMKNINLLEIWYWDFDRIGEILEKELNRVLV